MNSASLITLAIRVAEKELNHELVVDLLRVKQNEAQRKYKHLKTFSAVPLPEILKEFEIGA